MSATKNKTGKKDTKASKPAATKATKKGGKGKC